LYVGRVQKWGKFSKMDKIFKKLKHEAEGQHSEEEQTVNSKHTTTRKCEKPVSTQTLPVAVDYTSRV